MMNIFVKCHKQMSAETKVLPLQNFCAESNNKKIHPTPCCFTFIYFSHILQNLKPPLKKENEEREEKKTQHTPRLQTSIGLKMYIEQNEQRHYFKLQQRNVLSTLPVTMEVPFGWRSHDVKKCVCASDIVRTAFLPSFRSNARIVRSSATDRTTWPLA